MEAPRRRLHHYLLMALAWPLLLVVAVGLMLRWRDVDEVYLVALTALTPFLLAPLVLAVVSAWFSRSTTLRTTAAVVTAAALYTIAPFDAVIGCGPSNGEGAMTIMTANVLSGGGRADDIAATIAQADPDVVLLQEVNSRFLEQLADQPNLDPWANRSNEFPDATRGVLLWSKWPLSDVRHNDLDLNASVSAAVATPHGPVTVATLHTASPVSREDLDRWHEQFDGLSRLPTDTPMVLGGDFNATEDHRPFRHLLTQGWTDVHDDKGCGADLTWPADGLPFPVMRLDHILVTDHFEVLSTELAEPNGSDHHPVISRIRFADR